MIIFNNKEYDLETFKELVLNSSSYKEIANKLNITYCGRSLERIKNYIEEYQINFQTKYMTKEKIHKQNQDLIGKKIGRLTILGFDEEKNKQNKHIYLICQCDCKNKTIISIRKSSLLDKKRPTLSCGCLNREKAQEQGIKNREDLTGKRFGRITVISYNNQKSAECHKAYWNVECECGNQYILSSNSLRHSYSCGCVSSKGEYKVAKILSKNNILFEKEKTFQDLVGKNNNKLRFDFYLPLYNIIIECQGEQHYKSVEYFGGEKQFEKQLKYDNLKQEYCEKNNIKLIKIPYWNYDIIDEEYLLKLLDYSYIN